MRYRVAVATALFTLAHVGPAAADVADDVGARPTAVTAVAERPATDANPPDKVQPAVAEPLGLHVDLGYASAYNFRGLNFYGGGKQLAQHGMLAPSASWAFGKTGLSLAYFSAYPIHGDNMSELMKNGTGGEQDLTLAYTRSFTDALSASAWASIYVFPFATEAKAGTAAPVYLDPGVSATYATVVDLTFAASFLAGLQTAIAAYRYAYFRPSVGKKFEVSERVAVETGVGVGFKLFAVSNAPPGNRVDVGADVRVPIKIGKGYVAPGVHYAWTDVDGEPSSAGHMVFGSLNTGLDL